MVIELKNTKFIPEHAGKLNFYLSAVDSSIKQLLGNLLCRDKIIFLEISLTKKYSVFLKKAIKIVV